MPSISVILRKSYKKTDNTYPVYLRLTINRKSKFYSLNVSCLPKYWDSKKLRINFKNADNDKANLVIEKALKDSKSILFNDKIANIKTTFESFEDLFFGKTKNNEAQLSYYDFVKEQIALRVNTVSKVHTKSCEYEIEKLKRFRKQVLISEIDYKFLQEYEKYMRGIGNKTNTVTKSFSRMRTFLNLAVKNSIIEKCPFEIFKIKYAQSHREHLSLEELAELEKLLLDHSINKKLQNVTTWFLFSCYTGLRFSDLQSLTYNNVKEKHIELFMHKTKEHIIIPLIEKAKNLLPAKYLQKNFLPEETVFKIMSNQKCNDYLKLAMIAAGISKPISFHCSRHTFATVSITIGIPVEVVSKLLGHSDLKTTQIYAKIVDKKKFEEMEKWNKKIIPDPNANLTDAEAGVTEIK